MQERSPEEEEEEEEEEKKEPELQEIPEQEEVITNGVGMSELSLDFGKCTYNL